MHTIAPAEWAVVSFQPTPAGEGGRCCRSTLHSVPLPGFNPRPPVRAGDAAKLAENGTNGTFQPTPAGEGGRCASALSHCCCREILPASANHWAGGTERT